MVKSSNTQAQIREASATFLRRRRSARSLLARCSRFSSPIPPQFPMGSMSAMRRGSGSSSRSSSSSSSSSNSSNSSSRSKQSKLFGLSASFSSSSGSCNGFGGDLGDLKEEDVWGAAPSVAWEEQRQQDAWSSSSCASRNVDIPERSSGSSSGGSSSKKSLFRQQSAPMNVPDWAKILGSPRGDGDSSTSSFLDDDSDGERLPPHELAAREYASSVSMAFSVCEGAGHALKGRHMSRVRNAVLKQTGFL